MKVQSFLAKCFVWGCGKSDLIVRQKNRSLTVVALILRYLRWLTATATKGGGLSGLDAADT
jgi:hypothetical protein